MKATLWLALAALLPLAAAASGWTEAERTTLASLHIGKLPATPADASNAVEASPEAAALGKRLFFDTRLSANGRVACASCHAPERGFQDGRPLGQGLATGSRRTMPIAAASHGRWFFWDGRKDSLWSQALGPLEDGAEHGANRVQLVRLLAGGYRRDYEAVFGPLPALAGLPAAASPLGTPAEREAWTRLPAAQQDAVNRAFANLGKAIAAYERGLMPGETRLDRYIAGDASALSAQEVRGLRLFIGKAQCVSCHAGPLLSDQHFHNTGVAPRNPLQPDRGRAPAVARAQADPFNCLGPFSDTPPGGCAELSFIATDDERMEGAFKTPGLRNVAERAPFMHAGQIATLEDVVVHYVAAPDAAVGRSELARADRRRAERRPIALNAAEAADLVALLRALSGPICERGKPC
ncbi:cytochrome c peroxidase [Pelomonas saccharophila]|uniref:Cytochrome c peroxidase n=1 Tax=Roseateles saccharophilus TaxID=304 RepID=A0ABU1YID5_ROSSA|nr:cytochrome c peroxidase [Roseateles saccharophilus]MDR7268609.1 cytochrome c peroxidase [Roseateles saccharophilus]